MIINQVNVCGGALVPFEHQPPARNAFKFCQLFRRMDGGQHPAKPRHHVCPQQLAVTGFEEASQSFVANGTDHM